MSAMRHVNAATAEAAVDQTMRRLERINVDQPREGVYRDIIGTLSIHALSMGQFGVSIKIQEMLVGYSVSEEVDMLIGEPA